MLLMLLLLLLLPPVTMLLLLLFLVMTVKQFYHSLSRRPYFIDFIRTVPAGSFLFFRIIVPMEAFLDLYVGGP